ncbi:MAG: hypothetical protein WCX28_00135 [Bacteriovoracaceae bacterium]|nr:hypothetical protein [Bacteroidota bacterium]
MKPALCVILYILSSISVLAQDTTFCVSIHKDKQPEKLVAAYDSIYTPLGSIKLPDSVSIGTAWYQNFRPAFLEHVKNANIEWDTTTSVWIDLCCSPSGKIERVLYAARNLTDPNRELKFTKAIELFAKAYTFPISTQQRFSQCGSFKFMPEKK